MDLDDIQKNYLRYIGAGCVAAGGIISMFRTLPLILGSFRAGLRQPARRRGGAARRRAAPSATCRWRSSCSAASACWRLLAAFLATIWARRVSSALEGLLGAVLILLFGFLFVTVSSRLTGEIGSSSNPISGMTVATLL